MLKFIVPILISFISTAIFAQDASYLGGPQSSINSSGGASSPQTLNMLQPANPQTLQSAESGGINLPAAEQTLQQTQGSEDVKVLLEGETEGSSQASETEDSEQAPPYWVLGIPAVIALALWLRRRQR